MIILKLSPVYSDYIQRKFLINEFLFEKWHLIKFKIEIESTLLQEYQADDKNYFSTLSEIKLSVI